MPRGFSRTEFLEGRRINQVWVAMGSEVMLTRRITNILGVPAWMRDVLTDGKFGQMRTHARHNTLTNPTPPSRGNAPHTVGASRWNGSMPSTSAANPATSWSTSVGVGVAGPWLRPGTLHAEGKEEGTMAQEAVNPWEPFFDPLDDALWARGSDVDWLKGTYGA